MKDFNAAINRLLIKLRLMIVGLVVFFAGCSSIQSSISEGLAQSLSAGISNQTDIDMVKEGIASYLLMIDGMIVEDPENPDLYLAGAKLYSVYANFIQQDQRRWEHLTEKAYRYSNKVMCLTEQQWCALSKQTFDDYRQIINQVSDDDVDLLYFFAATWASQIESHKSDWNAIADLPKVKATMHRVIELDEQHDRGGAHLYLGVMETLIPPALGGKPGRRWKLERPVRWALFKG